MDPIRKKQLMTWAGWGAGAAIFLLLLPLTLPAVLGVLTAAALDEPVRRLQTRTGMGRSAASVLCVTGTLLVLVLILYVLGQVLLHELSALSGRLPDILASLTAHASALSLRLEELAQKFPGGVGDAFAAWARGLAGGSGALVQSLYERVFSLASRFLGALPGGLFFLVTMLLSCYFAALELPRLMELLRMHLPKELWQKLHQIRGSLHAALSGWFRAQLRLMAVTFLVLSAGFLLLRVDTPLPLALAVALLDALPVFGTGTVLIPWALLSLLTGDSGLGLGLAGLYGTAALLRNILEPRLLGTQLGVSPLLTLTAIYAGWRIGGFWGMVLLPVALVAAAQFWRSAHAPQPGWAAPVKHPDAVPVKYPEK